MENTISPQNLVLLSRSLKDLRAITLRTIQLAPFCSYPRSQLHVSYDYVSNLENRKVLAFLATEINRISSPKPEIKKFSRQIEMVNEVL